MKHSTYKLKRIVLLVSGIVLFCAAQVNGQLFHNLYWMQGIPQSSHANPAIQPLAGFYLGFPSVYIGVKNSGFAVMDLLKINENGNVYIDDAGMLSKFKNRNYLTGDINIGIFSFGFRAKSKNYFSFNINERIENRFGYSGDMLKLIIEGNDPFRLAGKTAEMGMISLDLSHFREFGLGYSRQMNNKLNLGIRAKALQGFFNVNFAKTDVGLFTDMDTYGLRFTTDLLVNKSLPVMFLPLDDFSSDSINFDDYSTSDYIRMLTHTGNMGFAVDLGATYKITPKIILALSARDLGMIYWKTDVENLGIKGNVDFNGVEIMDIWKSDDDDNPTGNILDSIINLFDRKETFNTYRTTLSPKVFASAAIDLTRMHRFAILARGEFVASKMYPSLTVSYNFQPLNRFGTSLSWSVIHGNIYNLGFGMHLNLLPIQFYVVLDNFFPAMQPHTFQHFNLQFGVNLAAGFRKKKDLTTPRFRW